MKAKRIVGLVVALGFVGGVAFVSGKTLSMMGKMGGAGGVGRSWNGIVNPTGEFPGRDRVNILMIGKDYNHDSKGMPSTKRSRSDTLILLSLDIKNRKASALSIPRDTYIRSRRGKINAAYAQGGAKLAMKTVGDLLGVQPDYYIALKPDAVRTIVDSIGGVDVEAKDKMKYDDHWAGLHIDLPAGRQHINGEQAIGFTRFRKVKTEDMLPDGRMVRLRNVEHSKEEGDDRRMARQQQLIKAMVAKAKQPQILLAHGDELIDTAFGAIETNLDRTQLLAIATLYKSVQPEQIQTATLMGKDGHAGRLYVFQPDPEKTKALVDWLIRGDESAVNKLTVVAVQNGTVVPGAARKVADLLKVEGYDADSTGNASAPKQTGEAQTTRITYRKAAIGPRAARIAQLLGGGTVVKEAPAAPGSASPTPSASVDDAADGPDVTIVLGRDLAPALAQREAHL